MTDTSRKAVSPLGAALGGWRRIVVKIGSALIVDAESGRLRGDWLAALAGEIADLRAEGRQVILVSSGAIPLGAGALAGVRDRLRLEERQAAAAIGQIRLAEAYTRAFAAHGHAVAQMLLTIGDLEDRRRYLNARNTLETLLAHAVIPVVNENDTVATQEIRFGDNDRLAARVAVMAEADGLLLLSDIDGLHRGDPRRIPDASLIPEVARLDEEIVRLAGPPAEGGIGSGGMITKIEAARIATAAGVAVGITDGRVQAPLAHLLEGRRTGTLFRPVPERRVKGRKSWLKGRMLFDGTLTIDEGAARALRDGASLLAAGICSIEGRFPIGALVQVCDEGGRPLAQGLVAHDSMTLARIRGLKGDEIRAQLGYALDRPVIHRDDLVMHELGTGAND
ncbi:MAG: glutamate 5-kinase [Alphaproteobacteria bacterium]|nr:MAG: glutamate 5-kinase [Alphaproteobacteria bacterium]